MYLAQYLARCGICSRRKAADLVKLGAITVNGTVEIKPSYLVQEVDQVVYQGKRVRVENYIYILLNKPEDYVTTCADPNARKTVLELVAHATTERVYPVGRLDKMTTGLLLLTNDGDLAQRLAHPKFNIAKRYHAVLDKKFLKSDFDELKKGITISDGPVVVDALRYWRNKYTEVLVEIHSGKKRVVRRMFKHLGYHVEKLDRTYYAGLTKKELPVGQWRHLSKQEVEKLKKM